MNIRPVSDLRNKFPEIESMVTQGVPVYLTKNGYGSMVVISIDQYEAMAGRFEKQLDEADEAAEKTSERYTGEEVFARARRKVNEWKKL